MYTQKLEVGKRNFCVDFQNTTSIMPMYKKRRVTTGRRSRPKKRSYGMVPRSVLNGEKMHRHLVTVSTSTGPEGVSPVLYLANLATGSCQFVGGISGLTSSSNMSVSFSLTEMVVALGGIVACTVPVPNASELIALYDTFQIEKVDFAMYFNCLDANTTVGATQGLPLIGYAPDMDDAANTSIQQLQQYSTYRIHQSSSPLKYSMVPCIAGAVFDPTIAGPPAQLGYSRVQKQDVNVGYGKTPHYGIKLAADGFRANSGLSNQLISVQARIHLIMKGTR